MTFPKRQPQISPTVIIGAAFCLGARDPRCDFGPEQIRRTLEPQLSQLRFEAEWHTTLHAPENVKEAPMEFFDASAVFFHKLGHQVAAATSNHQHFAVIGGDHSCAIGTWSGAAFARQSAGPIGLIWIDAHMDSHTPETSHSGALHGMPLACLLGKGDARLTQLMMDRPKLVPTHTCVIGPRSFEPEEAAMLNNLGVRAITKSDLKTRPLQDAIQEGLAIASAAPGGFGITIDLDVVDPVDAPGVGSPEPAGIPAAHLIEALAPLRKHPSLLGIEIAEYNPFRDRGNKTADLVIHLLSTLL